MGLSDVVLMSVSIAAAGSPTVQGLNTGLIAAYHNHYPDRLRQYSVATMLTQMVADGFKVTDPAYKAAQVYCAQSPAPANCCIGRRALPPLQSLTLTCVDGAVGDAYALTLIGSDGVSHALSYTNVIAPGVALASAATTSVTSSSTAVTFSSVQTLSKGTLLTFASQPGVYYALSANVTASTAGVLTTAYQGPTAAATATTQLAPLSGTLGVTQGSASVTTTTTQVGVVAVGDSVQFVSQLGTYYVVAAVTATTLTLTNPYTGTTAASTNASDVCSSSTAAAALQTQMAALTNVGTASVVGSVITLARTDGQLTDVKGWLDNGFLNIQLADNTADPGLAADLVAIQAANAGAWYALLLDSNSKAELLAAAAWIEATGDGGKILFGNTSDYANTQTGSSTNVFAQLQALSYKRTEVQQNNRQLLCYAGASAAAGILTANAGSYSLLYKSQPGVLADNDTTLPEGWALAINTQTASNPGNGGYFGNYYKTVAGQNWHLWGTSPGGQYMDITVGKDFTIVTMQARVAAALSSLPKTPFTDNGIGLLGDAVRGVLFQMATPAYNFVLPNGVDPTRPIVVNVPSAASIPQASRVARTLPAGALTWTCGLQGAINTVTVQGQLVP